MAGNLYHLIMFFACPPLAGDEGGGRAENQKVRMSDVRIPTSVPTGHLRQRRMRRILNDGVEIFA